LNPSDVSELHWYFEQRKLGAGDCSTAPEPRFAEAAKRFRAPRFNALYRTWEQGNTNALWKAGTSGLVDAFGRGDATLEFIALTRPYLYLTHLVGTA
jgi:hypothetical protein